MKCLSNAKAGTRLSPLWRMHEVCALQRCIDTLSARIEVIEVHQWARGHRGTERGMQWTSLKRDDDGEE